MGFTKPSKIQERALPLLLSNPCVSIEFFSWFKTFLDMANNHITVLQT